MKHLVYTTKAKIGYAVAIGGFLVGMAFVVAGILSIGCILSGLALSLAFWVAEANGHILPWTRRKSR